MITYCFVQDSIIFHPAKYTNCQVVMLKDYEFDDDDDDYKSDELQNNGLVMLKGI
jgi:hypothetical protein